MKSQTKNTFYWHDYETWGVNPAIDKPSQFAGVRTDLDLNIIGEPLNILCKPSLDTLPHVDAALVTRITPQHAAKNGIRERDFFAAIHNELARAGTCGVGYNSLRFDDEVSRYGFYRNFYDPYAREWQNGNSRWDIIDMVRLCYAVRPSGIEWPKDESGRVSFRLEKLTEANGIAHEGAHDALSDVYATIDMARLIKEKQPKLYEHVLALRGKASVQQALEIGSGKPKLHISSRFGAAFASASIILPIAVSPKNKNEIICIDLRYSPQPLFDFSVEEIVELQFTALADLPEGIERIPLKSVHLNRCPIVLSPGLVNDVVAERVQLDIAQIEKHRQQIIGFTEMAKKLVQVYQAHAFEAKDNDVDARLYEGFIPQSDKLSAAEVTRLDIEALVERQFHFEDDRLNELYFRYRARNYPESLSIDEQNEWRTSCAERLLGKPSEGQNLLENEQARIEELRQQIELDGQANTRPQPHEQSGELNALAIVDSVKQYLEDMKNQLSSY